MQIGARNIETQISAPHPASNGFNPPQAETSINTADRGDVPSSAGLDVSLPEHLARLGTETGRYPQDSEQARQISPTDRALSLGGESFEMNDAVGAITITDEGYVSMNKSEKPTAEGEEVLDKSDIASIQTDTRDIGLTTETKMHLANLFVNELLEDLPMHKTDRSVWSSAADALPDLLRQFSIMLESRARSGLEEKATTFVRHRR